MRDRRGDRSPDRPTSPTDHSQSHRFRLVSTAHGYKRLKWQIALDQPCVLIQAAPWPQKCTRKPTTAYANRDKAHVYVYACSSHTSYCAGCESSCWPRMQGKATRRWASSCESGASEANWVMCEVLL